MADRIVKFHRRVLGWTVMLSVAGLPTSGVYQYGSGNHPDWQLTWWRT